MPIAGLTGTGASGHLGTLYLTLTANAKGLVAGMNTAQAKIASSSKVMLAQAVALSKGTVLALGAVGAASVFQYAKFDKAMTNSLAIMGGVNAEMRKEMESTARLIAKETTTSAVEAAEAYFFLASAGLNARQSVESLNAVNQFAIAGNFSMALATDLVTDAQSALGLTVSDNVQRMQNLVRVSDVLVKANTLANATVEQFSTALTREAGAALKSFKIDVEEGVAVLAAFADQGVKGEIAGTSLSRILRLMTSAAVNNSDAYRELGVSVFDANGMLRNMADIVSDLEKALGSLSDEQRTVALETLGFQARVQGVILPLMGTSEAIRNYERELRKAGGTTNEVANKQLKSFSAQMGILWNNVNDVFLTIGEQIVPVLQALNAVLKDSSTGATDLGKSFQWIVNQVGPALVRIVGVIGDVFWGLKVILLGIKLVMLNVVKTVIDTVAKALQPVVNMINEMIRDINRIPGINIPALLGMDAGKLAALGEGLKEVIAETVLEAEKAIASGSFSERLIKEFDQIIDPVEKVMKEVENTVKESADKIISDFDRISEAEGIRKATEEINRLHLLAFGDQGGTQSQLAMPFSGDPMLAEMQALVDQQEMAEEQLAFLEEIANREVALTAETLEKKAMLQEAYNDQLRALQAAQLEIVIGAGEQMFGDLARITKSFAGEQSAAYKAMFAVSKAFAIADASVKIAQGIAAAASLPFPANLAAIASVVAATASIIQTIQSVKLTFAGGKASGGSVSPGKAYLVGEKGPELATFGSAANIIPNNKLGGGNVTVNVNNYTDAEATTSESNVGGKRVIEVIIKRVKDEIGSEVRDGSGGLTKSFEQTFGLRRGGQNR